MRQSKPTKYLIDAELLLMAMHPKDGKSVRAWLNQQDAQNLYVTSLCMVDFMASIALLAAGRESLGKKAAQGICHLFEGRVLPYRQEESVVHAALDAKARKQGFALTMLDGALGAIASTHDLTIVNANPDAFLALGLRTIQPLAD
jgi:predicted nucleic acid-binding protein